MYSVPQSIPLHHLYILIIPPFSVTYPYHTTECSFPVLRNPFAPWQSRRRNGDTAAHPSIPHLLLFPTTIAPINFQIPLALPFFTRFPSLSRQPLHFPPLLLRPPPMPPYSLSKPPTSPPRPSSFAIITTL